MAEYFRLFTYLIAASLAILVSSLPAYPASGGPSSAAEWTLAAALEKLAAEHEIQVKGLEKTRQFPARPAQGDLQQRLRQLLFDFNYVLVQSPQGGVERLLILGQKEILPPGPKQITLETNRSGDHHVIQAKLHGPSQAVLETALLVDTGASFVVLPASMIPRLGFAADALEDREIQTANGRIHANMGHLPALEIGSEVLHAVTTAFIDDELLGSRGLLGMNVLGRYRMTIDDQRNRITLIKPD